APYSTLFRSAREGRFLPGVRLSPVTCPLRSRGGADRAVVPPRWWVVPVWGGFCCLSGPVRSVWVSGDLAGHGRETAAVMGRGEGGWGRCRSSTMMALSLCPRPGLALRLGLLRVPCPCPCP